MKQLVYHISLVRGMLETLVVCLITSSGWVLVPLKALALLILLLALLITLTKRLVNRLMTLMEEIVLGMQAQTLVHLRIVQPVLVLGVLQIYEVIVLCLATEVEMVLLVMLLLVELVHMIVVLAYVQEITL